MIIGGGPRNQQARKLSNSGMGEKRPTIPAFFAGRSIFITGGSGFVGKVLIEKLLRCCPDITCLYVLMRGKNGQTPQERWDSIIQQKLFDRLKSEQPEAFTKVVLIEGDVMEKLLGLGQKDKSIIDESVSVVIHSAASVRFDDPLEAAVLLNTRGAREIVQLALKMKKLECLVYVSTTYCNTALNLPIVGEKIYPATQDWKTIIALAETTPKHLLSVLTEKILGNHPNTYTLSKSLAEQIMYEYRLKLPIVIFRPSVVISSLYEPIPGWIDNFNGPIGIMVGVNKGVVRAFRADSNSHLDYVAVDFAVNGLLVAAWHRATSVQNEELPVYNCAYGNIKTATFGELVSYGKRLAVELPFSETLWHPIVFLTANNTLFTIQFYLLHLFPGLLVDQALKISGRKPILTRLYQRLWCASRALHMFTTKSFHFENEHYRSLWTQVHPEDADTFYLNPKDVGMMAILSTCLMGVKKYLFKEPEDSNTAKKNYLRMYWLDRLVRGVVLGCLLWYLITKVI